MDERTCEMCPTDISHKIKVARFCSKSCADRSYRQRNLAEVTAYQRQYQLDHAERYRRNRRARYLANAEHRRAYAQAWRKANPDRVALNNHARRANRKAAGVFVITERDWRRLVERYRGCCAYCGKPPVDGVLHREHVVPLIRGGRHSIGNLVPACLACNYSKNRWLLTEWRHREGVLVRQGAPLLAVVRVVGVRQRE